MRSARVERVDRLLAAVWIAVGVIVLIADTQVPHVTISDPLGPAFLPNILAVALIGMGLILLRRRSTRPEDDTAEAAAEGALASDADEDAATGSDVPASGRQLVLATLVVVAYLALLPVIHFVPATVLSAATFMFIGGTRSWPTLTVYPAALAVALNSIFSDLLGVRLP